MARQRKKMEPAAVMAAIEGAGKDLDLSELAGELLDAFGGARELAQQFVKEFKGERTSPTARSRMLETVMRILTAASPKTDPLLGSLGTLSADQLQTLLQRFLAKGGAA